VQSKGYADESAKGAAGVCVCVCECVCVCGMTKRPTRLLNLSSSIIHDLAVAELQCRCEGKKRIWFESRWPSSGCRASKTNGLCLCCEAKDTHTHTHTHVVSYLYLYALPP